MKRQLIIDNLKSLLSEVKTSNGYETNVGDNVISSHAFDFEDVELPLVNIIEDPEGADVVDKSADIWLHDCPFRVDVITLAGIEYVRKCVNDILIAINNDIGLGDTCVDIEVGNIAISLTELEKTYSIATIVLRIKYITKQWRI